jgi:hypothetical protein
MVSAKPKLSGNDGRAFRGRAFPMEGTVRTIRIAILALSVVTCVRSAEAVHEGASSPCCAQSTVGAYVGKSCDENSGCFEDPAGTGTCVGGTLVPPLVGKLQTVDDLDRLQDVLESCVPTEPVPGETPEERLTREQRAIANCMIANACVCIGDGTQVACFVRDGNVSQAVCTRRAVLGCCTTGVCH